MAKNQVAALNKRTLLWIFLAIVVLIGLSIALLVTVAKTPFIFISILWFLACLAAAVSFRGRWRRIATFVGASLLALTAGELFLDGWFPGSQTKAYLTLSPSNYYIHDPILGAAPRQGQRVRAKKTLGNETMYDVHYTISDSGLRVGPERATNAASTVLFFGGSLTFGEGVEDHETLPAQIEAESEGNFRAINFGFHGYGPHQMLASLEDHREGRELIAGSPAALVYQALPDHVLRSSGKRLWARSGPRYVLNNSGTPQRSDAFHSIVTRRALASLSRAATIQRLTDLNIKHNEEDVILFTRLIETSAQLFEARYDGRFIVLLWATGSPLSQDVEAALAATSLETFMVSEAIPDLLENPKRYTVGYPIDAHPNAMAYSQVAAYLLTVLISDADTKG